MGVAAHPSTESPASLITMNGYMATADLTASNPAHEIRLVTGTTQTANKTTGIWSGAGFQLLTALPTPASSGWFGFDFSTPKSVMKKIGVAANGELNIYFAKLNAAADARQSQSLYLSIVLHEPVLAGDNGAAAETAGAPEKTCLATFKSAQLAPVATGTVSTAVTQAGAGPNFTQLAFTIDAATQLFAVKLMAAPNSNHKLFSILAMSETLGMQAFCCPFAPQVKLRFPTLRHRVAPTLQTHTNYDLGTFQPSTATLKANKLSVSGGANAEGYVVSRFGVLNGGAAPLVIQHATHYATADTSVSSPSLVGKMVLHKPPHTVTASTAQSFWKNASILAAPSFTVDEDGVAASRVTLFFTPIMYEASDGSAHLTKTSTKIEVWGPAYRDGPAGPIGPTGPAPPPLPLPLPLATPSNTSMTVNGWVLATTADGRALTLSAPATQGGVTGNTLLPYIELTAQAVSVSGTPPLLSKVDSSEFPIQAFTADFTVPASAADLTSPCFSYQAVAGAGLVLYTDVTGNVYRFQDPDAGFNLTNEALDVAVRTVKKIPDTFYGRFFTETRPSDADTANAWLRTADGNGATVYNFEEYTAAATEYPKRGKGTTSVILLRATNYTAAGVASGSGYVACATHSPPHGSTVSTFAPAAASSATPLLVDLATAVAQGVQWGVVQIQWDQSKATRGISQQARPTRCLGLIYSDNNLAAPMPLTLASFPTGSSPNASPTLDLKSPWLAHGVWQAGSTGATLVYDASTMLVKPLDVHNVIQGTGFTPANAPMQWLAHAPAVNANEKVAAALLNQIQSARKSAAASAEFSAAAAAAMYRHVKFLSTRGAVDGNGGSKFNVLAVLASVTALNDVAQAQAVIAENATRPLIAAAAAAAANVAAMQIKAALVPILHFKAKGASGGVFSPKSAAEATTAATFSPVFVSVCLLIIVFVCLASLFIARRFTNKA